MADGTSIEWVRSPDGRAGATWNVITGCKVKSPGCIFCYAMKEAGGGRTKHHPSRIGLTREVNGHHVWTGEVRFNTEWLDQPLHWARPRDVFVVAHGDLFYEAVPDGWIMRLLHVMGQCRQHTFRILTKRPDRARAFLAKWADLSGEGGKPKIARGPHAVRAAHPSGRGQLFAAMLDAMGEPTAGRPFPVFDWALGMKQWPAAFENIWIGVSVERQQEADERREDLAAIAAMGWNTWVSYEPALGPVDWSGWQFAHWIVSGGESGRGARPSHPDWHRTTRDWCSRNGIPYFFKQWGEWHPHGQAMADGAINRLGNPELIERWHNFGSEITAWLVGKTAAGARLDDVEHKAMPR